MIGQIKDRIWELLRDKEISLAMIFNTEGEILWHRGRRISGRKLTRGAGYCSTPVFEVLGHGGGIQRECCSVTFSESAGTESARMLDIKSLLILPLNGPFFLYLDSGEKKGFADRDIAVFQTLGALLGGLIEGIRNGYAGKNLSGTSPQTMDIREKVVKYSIEEDPVLLLGETGVGKNHVAEMIHHYSGRSGAFVVVNTPGIPDTLIEAQLFGHKKGAFSGAVAENEGLVAAAERGTLFMDEIAELEPSLQAKLLRFIDTRKYYRLGENRELQADIRIIAATNRDLNEAIAAKTFREDLFYRLNCLTIEIPPLRERPEDIDVLLKENKGLLRGKSLSEKAVRILRNYEWPGNVRELLQVLKAAGIRFDDDLIGSEISGLLTRKTERSTLEGADKVEAIWNELLEGRSFWEAVKAPFLDREIGREEAREIIERGLRETKGRYVGLVTLFNLEKGDYKNFMRFIYANRLK